MKIGFDTGIYRRSTPWLIRINTDFIQRRKKKGERKEENIKYRMKIEFDNGIYRKSMPGHADPINTHFIFNDHP